MYRGKPCPTTTLFTSNPSWADTSLHGEMLPTNCLSLVTAILQLVCLEDIEGCFSVLSVKG
jgi:hypothetical protein